jgi:AraC-like DNA-binding protein
MARPRLRIDEVELARLAATHTVSELAAHLGCSKRTLERRYRHILGERQQRDVSPKRAYCLRFEFQDREPNPEFETELRRFLANSGASHLEMRVVSTASSYIKARRSKDVWFRIRGNVASLMRTHLSNASAGKPLPTQTILARYLRYSVAQLIRHLESQFLPGMTWQNYGTWHIDHKIPASWFRFDSVEDEGFRKCWALENLQPKWADENYSKGNRFADEGGRVLNVNVSPETSD